MSPPRESLTLLSEAERPYDGPGGPVARPSRSEATLTQPKATIRRAIRAAPASGDGASHALQTACQTYQELYGISYDTVRYVLNGELPADSYYVVKSAGA